VFSQLLNVSFWGYSVKNLIKLGVNFIKILRAPFAPIFLHQYFCAKKLLSQNVTRENLFEAFLDKKIVRKM